MRYFCKVNQNQDNMGLFSFLFGVMAGNAVSNNRRNNSYSSQRQTNNNYFGGCYDDIECNCDHDDCNYESYDNYDNYDNGYCDEECEERY